MTGSRAVPPEQPEPTEISTSALKSRPEGIAKAPVPLSVAIARMASSTRMIAPKELRAQHQTSIMSKVSSIEATNMIAAGRGHLQLSVPGPAGDAKNPSTATRSAPTEPAPAARMLHTATATSLGTESVTKSDSTRGAPPTPSREPLSRDQEPQPPAKVAAMQLELESRRATAKAFGEVPSPIGEPNRAQVQVVRDDTPPDSLRAGSAPRPSESESGELQARPNHLAESQAIGIKPRLVESLAAPPIALPVRGSTDRGRITIGRLDVQVNNHRRVQPNAAAERAPVFAARSGYVEALCLERLLMRP
jgi:hypothetical protein